MTLEFKPEDFMTPPGSSYKNAAEVAQNKFDEFWGELIVGAPKVYDDGSGGWSPNKMAHDNTVAFVVNIKEFKNCKHEGQKIPTTDYYVKICMDCNETVQKTALWVVK